MKNEQILGVAITSASEGEILEYITKGLDVADEKYYIVTPNPEIIVFANKDTEFKRILNEANVSLPDGMGVVWASKLMGKGIKSRIGGVDFMEKVCFQLSKRQGIVGFLGGGSGVAERTADRLVQKYHGLRVGFVGTEWPEDKLLKEHNLLIDFLFVAFGFPKQEKWIHDNLDKLPVKVAMGVGGSFDYISGKVSRAPKIVRTFGFEWLYRLILQPWRWKRQLSLIIFVWLVIKEFLKMKFGFVDKSSSQN